MSLVRRYLTHPHLILSLVLLGVALGAIGFGQLPVNLFPEANYPSVSVLLIWPGAAAEDVQTRVTRRVDAELSSLDQSRSVRAVTRDEVSAVTVEFDYKKGINAAVVDVAAALDRILASLPGALLPPRIFKITDATSPVATLAVRPADDAVLDFTGARQLADNELREALLRIPEVAAVEVFGGTRPAVEVVVFSDRLESHNLSLEEVTAAISAQNRNIPGGTVVREREQFLIKIEGERLEPVQIGGVVLQTGSGDQVHLRDVARIVAGGRDRFSFFHGNGKPAVGINILRPENGNVTTTLKAVRTALPELRRTFPALAVEVVDTTGDVIETSISNMVFALRDAVLLTVGVILVFLARVRTTLLTAVSIPITFLLTFAGMRVVGLELNIVTMTAIILSVGLLVDDSIVVIENIDRHLAMEEKGGRQAAIEGTEEIYLADFSGTLTTVVVLLPIMFIGGYTGKILRPLTMTLSLALFFSYLVSVTVIPLLAPYLNGSSRPERRANRILARFSNFLIEPLRSAFVRLFLLGEKRRGVFVLAGLVLFVFSMRQVPLAGRDLMPPMDTGIVKIDFETAASASLASTEKAVLSMERQIRSMPGFLRMSTVAGSENGVISFGAERSAQEGNITAHFVDRFQRKDSIWRIEERLRKRFAGIEGLASFQVYDYGATPLSSIRAPVVVRVTGPDPEVLSRLADQVAERLSAVKGLTDIGRSWRMNKKEVALILDQERLARYGLTPAKAASALHAATQGIDASTFRVPGQVGYRILLRYGSTRQGESVDLEALTVASPAGPVPLAQIGRFEPRWTQTRLIREDLVPAVDVLGYRGTAAVSHIQERVNRRLADVSPPAGYRIRQEGEIRFMKESFSRLGGAILLAVILVYFSLVSTFRSFAHPLTIMLAIPLAFIGVVWAMLIAGRHFCMPAFMGVILLSGIVVNNSILLMDFIGQARGEGQSRQEAIVSAIRTRTRPIVMTATSTIVGMTPIALELAVGLERLSPLAVVAIGGLVVSTALTLVYVPIFYTLVDDARTKLGGRFARRPSGGATDS